MSIRITKVEHAAADAGMRIRPWHDTLIAAAWLDQAGPDLPVLLDAGANSALQDGQGSARLSDASGRVVFELLVAAQFRNAATRRADALAYLNGKVSGRDCIRRTALSTRRHGSWVSPSPPPPPPPTQGAPLVAVQPESEPRPPWVLRAELLLSLGANPNNCFSGEADWTTLAIPATNGDERAARYCWRMEQTRMPAGAWPSWSRSKPGKSPQRPPVSVAEHGTTPLIVAAIMAMTRWSGSFSESGADPTLRDWRNGRARDYAVELKRQARAPPRWTESR